MKTTPNPSDEALEGQVLALVSQHLHEAPQKRDMGANLGNMLRRQLPGFTPTSLGYPSLSRLLQDLADNLTVVGRKGDDWMWALGESLDTQDIERALSFELDGESSEAAGASARVARVDLRNFRVCRDVALTLADTGLTVLVGPNAAGKSTLMYGISFASQVTRGRLVALFSGPRDVRRLRSFGSSDAVVLGIETFDGVELRMEASSDGDETEFVVRVRNTRRAKQRTWTSPGPRPEPPLSAQPVGRAFWPSVLLRFRPEALAAPSEIVEGAPRLGFDGSGLPTVLAHLANTDPERLERIVAAVREVVPGVRRTRQHTRRRDSDGALRHQLEVEVEGAGWVPADLLSEGTLFAFGVHTVLHQSQPPRILLMDDIDRGIHPKAQRTLITQLRSAAEAPGAPSIVLSTHSPYILDEVPPESVRIVRAAPMTGTTVRALVDHHEWAEWRGHMTSGEFWTYVGEEWLEQAG